MTLRDPLFESATRVRAAIEAREISCQEVLEAHLQHISRVNNTLNAIVTHTQELAMDRARSLDKALARGEDIGLLGGLPVAHKDLAVTRGVRTTFGSTTMSDHVPDEDALIVSRMHQAGAVMVGKTNTPEFGAGSQTFNAVFGATCNPYDPSKTCGGSSGGAAVALAAGMISLADGSDMGGSLRNPAAWCNVVGLRPTPGRVPSWPTGDVQATLPVEGPMARTVQDVALLMAAISGPDPRCPLSQDLPDQDFLKPLETDLSGRRIAISADFGGLLPLVTDMPGYVEHAGQILADLGAGITPDLPDLAGTDEVFKTLRAGLYAGLLGPTLERNRNHYKKTLVWNIEQGLALEPAAVQEAVARQQAIRAAVDAFFTRYDFLLLPVTQVHPFALDVEYPTSINDTPMQTYLDWMASCYYVTVPGHPAVSVPAGFTADGLPVGVQIVGRFGDDFGVLQIAYALQEATGHWQRRPDLNGLTSEMGVKE